MASFGAPPSGGSSIPAIDASTYPAYVAGVVLLGTYPNEYKGEKKPDVQQLLLMMEIVGQTFEKDDGEELPRTIPKWVNYVAGDKSNYAKIAGVFDTKNPGEFLGKPCLVAVSQYGQEGSERNKITDFQKPIAGMPMEEMKSAPMAFNFYDPDYEEFCLLPAWIQNKVKENLDYPGSDFAKLVAARETNGGEEATSALPV